MKRAVDMIRWMLTCFLIPFLSGRAIAGEYDVRKCRTESCQPINYDDSGKVFFKPDYIFDGIDINATIRVQTGKKVKIHIEEMNNFICTQPDYLQFYDENSVELTQTLCQTGLPSIYSRTNGVTFHFVASRPAFRYLSLFFKFKYEAVDPEDVPVNLQNECRSGFNPLIISGTRDYPRNEIRSHEPILGERFAGNLDCGVHISLGYYYMFYEGIKLTISWLKFDNCWDSDSSNPLAIYNGSDSTSPLLETICGGGYLGLPRTIFVKNHHVYIKFHTEDNYYSDSYGGFVIKYEAYDSWDDSTTATTPWQGFRSTYPWITESPDPTPLQAWSAGEIVGIVIGPLAILALIVVVVVGIIKLISKGSARRNHIHQPPPTLTPGQFPPQIPYIIQTDAMNPGQLQRFENGATSPAGNLNFSNMPSENPPPYEKF